MEFKCHSPSGQHLRIQDVKVRDAGDYVCRAENSIGREEATASLEAARFRKRLALL